MQILYAEDDLISQKILVRNLASQGYDTVTFHDGQAALDYYKEHPVSIIISDWMMPRMDGLALCRNVRALKRPDYTHFIMLTAKHGQEEHRKAMEAGVDDSLTKPVNKEDLVIRLRVAERIIEQRLEAEQRIRELARFPEDNPNPVLQVDRAARIIYANRASYRLLEEWGCRLGSELPDSLGVLEKQDWENGHGQTMEISCGDQIYSFAVTSVHEGDTVYLYGHNITDQKRAESALVKMKNKAIEASLHDQLTGLPNRILLDPGRRRLTAS